LALLNRLRGLLRYALGRRGTDPIFVIGTGRSGTNWVGHVLQSHPRIRVAIEESPMFPWSTAIALDPTKKSALFPRLIRSYQHEILGASPRAYADKSHPNIWFAEDLLAAFPDARFVGIERQVYPTVASMLRHEGVLSWHGRWREFPLPNLLLGIDEAIAAEYDALPTASKCALRWRSHQRRLRELRGSLGDRLLLLSYERLIEDTQHCLEALQAFLGLPGEFPVPEVRRESLDKWKNQLTESEIQEIDAVLEVRG
jgi:hypothetical protein